MVPRRFLVVLVYALAVLLVAFFVLGGGAMLLAKTGDEAGVRALRWTAASCITLLVIDLILLVGALGMNAIASSQDESEDSS